MGDFKLIKWNICFEVTLVKVYETFCCFYFLQINQNLGTNFGAPKSGYRSQNQPVSANQLTGFYMMGTLVVKRLTKDVIWKKKCLIVNLLWLLL